MLPKIKKCRTCGELKILDDFYKEKLGKLGRRGSCIECVKTAVRLSAAAKKTKKFELLVEDQPSLMPKILDEQGVEVDFETAKEDPQLAAVVAQAMSVVGQRKMLENNRPEVMTDDFVAQVKATAALLTTFRLPTVSCSCCRLNEGEDRGTYRICARCAVSVDKCGRCVLHCSAVFRPELQPNAPPTIQQVLEALGEDQPPLPTRPPLRNADGQLPPEDDS